MSDEAPAVAGIAALAIDCADPPELASWWSRLLGGEVEGSGMGSAERAGHCCILGSWVGSAYMGGQP
jgi:hypothetical protein